MATRMSRPASADAAVSSTVVVPNTHPMVALLGANDENIKQFERDFPEVDVLVRGNEIRLSGDVTEIGLAEQVLAEMLSILRTGQSLSPDAVERSVAMLRTDRSLSPSQLLTANILSTRGKAIRAKTLNQKRYVDAIDPNTIVFGIGPAGTGKTYLAVAKAVQALQAKQINRIILTRPAVEAGERLGFLPGTLSEKIDPYLRPLYDALHDMIDPDRIPQLMTSGHHRGRAVGLHARADAQRRVHHPRRGAEHHGRADEDVPDPARVRIDDGRHRGRHTGRPAGRHHERSAHRAEDPLRHR
jgi:phosphate starvation-inducible PhoH-like protein